MDSDSFSLENVSRNHRIQAFDRALEIPSVNYLWYKSAEVYTRVKCVNRVVRRALDTLENAVSVVAQSAMPVARLMEKPIFTLDRSLCQGIDFVQFKLPIVKEDPMRVILFQNIFSLFTKYYYIVYSRRSSTGQNWWFSRVLNRRWRP